MTSITNKEYYSLNMSIIKALNPTEAPLKMKHARSIIITTHRTKDVSLLWKLLTQQPLMENRFIAWKFCHLLHKVLREGQENCIINFQTHKKFVLEMGKHWGYLQDGVGACIQAYSQLLAVKLDFHHKNSLLPGSLLINFSKIESFACSDINIYFQLCVEIFDYLDEIINVQSKIFFSINSYRMSSMSPQGQCRLAPIITLIQDSNPLYDISVRIMFKLHNELPNDTLVGHRDRFRDLFVKIKSFYDNVRPLQYFADLLQVPLLPDVAPNFSSKIDFGNYVPPKVFFQPDAEPEPENLIDTSILQEPVINDTMVKENNEEITKLTYMLEQKHIVIQQIEDEISTLKSDSIQRELMLTNKIAFLQEEIRKLELDNIKTKELAEDMEIQLKHANEIKNSLDIAKNIGEQQNVISSEEKFTKLKLMYAQIRDEHINLLRQHGETNKILNTERQNNSLLQNELTESKVLIRDMESKLTVAEKLKEENSLLETNMEDSINKYDSLLIEHEKFKTEQSQLKVLHETKLIDQINEAENLKITLNDLKTSFLKESEEQEKEKLMLRSQINNKLSEMQRIQEKCEIEINLKETELSKADTNLQKLILQLKEKEEAYESLIKQKDSVELNNVDLIKSNEICKERIVRAESELEVIKLDRDSDNKRHKTMIMSLMSSILKINRDLFNTNFIECYEEPFNKAIITCNDIIELLEKLDNITAQECIDDASRLGELAVKYISFSYNCLLLHEKCILMSKTSTDILHTEELTKKLYNLKKPIILLYSLLSGVHDKNNITACITDIKSELRNILLLLKKMQAHGKDSLAYDQLIEREIYEMEKAIEEAAEKFVLMLKSSKSNDNGLKLEVNEKILDACTNLIKCIKELINNSKVLQEEILSTGCGSISVTEFYTRNSHWTDGLISASKSVAKGANLLVEAANKSVSTANNDNFEIIVAAQEIAACTAQLVLASKVKASRSSSKLKDLTKASRYVSEATGILVATVKDCNHQLEQLEEIDLTKLTASQAKTMEMDIQVKVLELEQALQTERIKLSSFRRKFYHSSDGT